MTFEERFEKLEIHLCEMHKNVAIDKSEVKNFLRQEIAHVIEEMEVIADEAHNGGYWEDAQKEINKLRAEYGITK